MTKTDLRKQVIGSIPILCFGYSLTEDECKKLLDQFQEKRSKTYDILLKLHAKRQFAAEENYAANHFWEDASEHFLRELYFGFLADDYFIRNSIERSWMITDEFKNSVSPERFSTAGEAAYAALYRLVDFDDWHAAISWRVINEHGKTPSLDEMLDRG